MRTDGLSDVYSLREVALAAGVNEAQAFAAAGSDRLLSSRDAFRLGRVLIEQRRANTRVTPAPLFSGSSGPCAFRHPALPLAVSGSLHGALLASAVFILGFHTTAATTVRDDGVGPQRLIFLATPGPGGGGGGGGHLEKAPPRQAEKIAVTPKPPAST